MKEQNKYDQTPSGLRDCVKCILARKVSDEIVSEETEISKGLTPQMFEVMCRVTISPCNYVKLAGDHIISRLDKLLMVAARRIGGPVYPEMIKEMERELNKVIEDFGLAVNVEALQPAKTSKFSFSQIC